MAISLNASFVEEKNKLEGTAPIRLFEITYGDSAASKLHFAAWNEDIDYFLPNTATAQTYTKAPLELGNLEYSFVEEMPGVDITISNVDRTITSYLELYDGLRGRDITQIRVFKSLLNNPSACIVEKYYVDSAQVGTHHAQLRLAPKVAVYKLTVPKRIYRRNQCQWRFKTEECTGTSGTPTNSTLASPSITTCMKTLGSCASYNNISNYGGFPGIPRRRVIFA